MMMQAFWKSNNYFTLSEVNMTLGNIQKYLPNTPLLTNQSDEKQERLSRGGALVATAVVVATLGQIIVGGLGIAEKIAPVPLGWTLVGLAGTSILVPALQFIFGGEDSRSPMSLCSHVISPIVVQSGPLVCGALAATGDLPAKLASTVTVGVIGGLISLTCCCACCMMGGLKCLESCKENEGDTTDVNTTLLSEQLNV